MLKYLPSSFYRRKGALTRAQAEMAEARADAWHIEADRLEILAESLDAAEARAGAKASKLLADLFASGDSKLSPSCPATFSKSDDISPEYSPAFYRQRAKAIRQRAEVETDDERWEDIINAMRWFDHQARMAERRAAKASEKALKQRGNEDGSFPESLACLDSSLRRSSAFYRQRAKEIRQRAEVEADDERWEDLIYGLQWFDHCARVVESREAEAKSTGILRVSLRALSRLVRLPERARI